MQARSWLAFAVVLLICALSVILFARVQDVWIDETTQLSGMTLPPGDLLAWLAGDLRPPFGVPPDRMPPLSYLVDMPGWHLWGHDVLAFRLYHAAIAGVGLLVLMLALARRFGARAALVAGLIFALSPRFVEIAVEIRAYPLFLALSCLQLALVLQGDVAVRTGRLALFVLLGALSGYTHFFGVVATGAYALAVLADVRDVRGFLRLAAAGLLLLLLWAGLAPFILGASAISAKGAILAPGAGDVPVFLLQLLGASAILVVPVAALLYLGGAGLLALLGALGLGAMALRDGARARHLPAVQVALVLIAGLLVTLAAAFLVKGFDALSPRYNIWMLPPVAVLLALAADGAIGLAGPVVRRVRLAALAVFAVGALWSHAAFLDRADWFIHGPGRLMDGMIADAPGPVAVVHAGDGWAWGFFPLYWRHRDALPQYLLRADGGAVVRIGRGGDPSGAALPLAALDGYRTLLVGRIDLNGYRDLRRLARGEAPPLRVPPAAGLAGAGWQAGPVLYRPGNYAFTGLLYRKPQPQPRPQPAPRPSAPRIMDDPQ